MTYANTAQVKRSLEAYIKANRPQYITMNLANELSIFDMWKNTLTMSDMKKMFSFVKTAQAFGFNGYICFKVGAKGCANGMWAYRNESTDGYSPDGDFIYRSFTPDYTDWNANLGGEFILPIEGLHTRKELINALEWC